MVTKCCTIRKIQPCEVCIFCICLLLRAEIITIFEPKMVQNLQTLQDYIFQALQHFATKSCIFTNYSMFFLAAVFHSLLFTYRLKFSLTCKLSIGNAEKLTRSDFSPTNRICPKNRCVTLLYSHTGVAPYDCLEGMLCIDFYTFFKSIK